MLSSRAGGYAIVADPDKGCPEEVDTFTCAHCNHVVHCIDPRSKRMANPYDLGGLCRCCDRLICSNCVGKDCVPLMKQIEAMEARDRLYKDMR